MNSHRISPLALWIGLFVLIVDQLTKFLTYRFLPLMDYMVYKYPYGGIGVFKNFFGVEFSISHATNYGAAWGIFGEYQLPLVVMRIALIAGLIVYTFFYNTHRSWSIFLVLITAGALGNVIDFFLYGHVIDMLHVVLWGYDFPVFNIADSAITIGVVGLFLLSLSPDNSPQRQ